jgi:micrococcal nuclease
VQRKPEIKYIYENVEVLNVYDADTITVKVFLGFNIDFTMKVRLYGINAPELRGEERVNGLIARDYLRDRILGKKIKIETLQDKQGKFGRYLAVVWLNQKNINNELVDKKYATYRQY